MFIHTSVYTLAASAEATIYVELPVISVGIFLGRILLFVVSRFSGLLDHYKKKRMKTISQSTKFAPFDEYGAERLDYSEMSPALFFFVLLSITSMIVKLALRFSPSSMWPER